MCSRPLWVSPRNSPVRLGVSPLLPQPPQVFSIRDLRLYFRCCSPGLRSLSRSAVVPPGIRTRMRDHPLHQLLTHWVLQLRPCRESSPPGCPSPPLLPVWMNVSSLTPWLSDFHTVRFCQFSLFFVFKLLPAFWLCEEAQCV